MFFSLGCKLKRPFGFIIHCCLSPIDFHLHSTKLFSSDDFSSYPLLVRKNLLNIFNKFFSIYNYLFRFFLYSVFNEHLLCNRFLQIYYLVEMMGFDSRANYALGLPRSQTSTGSLLCTDSPSNPLCLYRSFSKHPILWWR